MQAKEHQFFSSTIKKKTFKI